MLKHFKHLQITIVVLIFTLFSTTIAWGCPETENTSNNDEAIVIEATQEVSQGIPKENDPVEEVTGDMTEPVLNQDDEGNESEVNDHEQGETAENEFLEKCEDSSDSRIEEEAPTDTEELKDETIESSLGSETKGDNTTEIPEKELPQTPEQLTTDDTEWIILSSIEGIPLEAEIIFTLNGEEIGYISEGMIISAAPIHAKEKDEIKASVLNRIRIVGAKINFEPYSKIEHETIPENIEESVINEPEIDLISEPPEQSKNNNEN